MAVAVGATAMTTSGSSAPTSTIAPSVPSGLLAQIDQRVKVSLGTEPPLGVGRHGEGDGASMIGGDDLDLRPGDPLAPPSARETTRPVIVPFSGRGIRKSRTSSVSSLTVIFSSSVRGGPIKV